MAQLVEHRTPNPRVGGSSPSERAKRQRKITLDKIMAKKIEPELNPISKGIRFYNESLGEVKKVHPPTKEETIRMTIVVLIALVVFSAFLGMADLVVGKLMRSILT